MGDFDAGIQEELILTLKMLKFYSVCERYDLINRETGKQAMEMSRVTSECNRSDFISKTLAVGHLKTDKLEMGKVCERCEYYFEASDLHFLQSTVSSNSLSCSSARTAPVT